MNFPVLQAIIAAAQAPILVPLTIQTLAAQLEPLPVAANGSDLTGGNTVLNGGIAMGGGNTADGPHTMVFGLGNYGHYAGLVVGRYNTVGTVEHPANDAFALGAGLYVIGDNAFARGINNSATGDRGDVAGMRGDDRGIEGANVLGFSGVNYLGDVVGPRGEAQRVELGLRAKTVGAQTMRATSSHYDLNSRWVTAYKIPDHSVALVKGETVVRAEVTDDASVIEWSLVMQRGVGAASIRLLDIRQAVRVQPLGTLAISFDNDWGVLVLNCQGVSGKTLHWVSRLISVENA